MCSEISSHTTLLVWLMKELWQLAQRLSLSGRSLGLPLGLLQEDRGPASVVLLSPIFTLCLSSFHENLPISPLIFKPYSSSLPLPLPLPLLLELESSFSLLRTSGDVRTEGLLCMGEPTLNWLLLRRGEGENRGLADTGLSDMDKGLADEAGLPDRLGLLDGDGDKEEGDAEGRRELVVVEAEGDEVEEAASLRP